jgi:hypothetical protein
MPSKGNSFFMPSTVDDCHCRPQVTIVLSTGYVCAWLVAMVLDNMLPREVDSADRIRELALHERLEMDGKAAHLIEDEMDQQHKAPSTPPNPSPNQPNSPLDPFGVSMSAAARPKRWGVSRQAKGRDSIPTRLTF